MECAMTTTPTCQERGDQAARLRALAKRSDQAAVIAVTSGKGGVGKSNVAVNVSVQLAASGLRVVLVDLDLGLANDDLLLDIVPRHTLAHVVAGVRSVQEVVVSGPAGLSFVPGASGVNALANLCEFERRHLLGQLEKLTPNADIMVLDCGAGISENVLAFAQWSDGVLVVTTPQTTALADAYAMIKSLHRERFSGSIRILVNMVQGREQARAAFQRVSAVARKFLNYSVADAGYMLHDTAVERAVMGRCPFVVSHPRSNASACIAALADDLAQDCTRSPQRTGMFQRVVGLFV